jgi:hypothetical protein
MPDPNLNQQTGAQPPVVRRGNAVWGMWGSTQVSSAYTGAYSELAATMNPLNVPLVQYTGRASGAGDGFAAFDVPPPGTFEVYRKIARYPTVAMPLAIIDAHIESNEWTWRKRDDDQAEARVKLLDRWFAPQRQQIVHDGMMALRYGFSPFEKVWELVDPMDLGVEGIEGKVMLPRLKPLRVDYTTFRADSAYKRVIGIRNRPPYATKDIDLDTDKCFWFTFGGEAGDPYGESLFENIRDWWNEATQVRQKISKYVNKISGVIGQVHYPVGSGRDATGVETTNYELAQQIAAAGSEGRWILMPNRFSSFIPDPNNVTPAQIEMALGSAGKSEWVVSFVDPGGADHSGGFKELLQYYDVLMVRGLLNPERALLESQKSGSRADSQMHGQQGAIVPQALVTRFVLNFNAGVTDNIIEINNWGPKGSYYAEPDPLNDDEYDAKLKTLHAGLQSPDVGPGLAQKIDWVQTMDDLGVAVLEDERETPLDILSQIMPPDLKLPGSNGELNRNGNGPRTAPVGRALGVR